MENHCAHEEACAAVAAQFSQRWLREYAKSKLRRDPVFAAAYDLLGQSNEPLLDIGCGAGLLPRYLRARGYRSAVIGLDTDGRKIREAQTIAPDATQFIEQDARAPLPQFSGNVVLFDVLHYLDPDAQKHLLGEAAARLSANGVLLLRDALNDGSARFVFTYLGEVFAQTLSWNISRRLHFPTRDSISAAFSPNKFTCQQRPMYGRTPFNNRLFIFRRRGAGPDAE